MDVHKASLSFYSLVGVKVEKVTGGSTTANSLLPCFGSTALSLRLLGSGTRSVGQPGQRTFGQP